MKLAYFDWMFFSWVDLSCFRMTGLILFWVVFFGFVFVFLVLFFLFLFVFIDCYFDLCFKLIYWFFGFSYLVFFSVSWLLVFSCFDCNSCCKLSLLSSLSLQFCGFEKSCFSFFSFFCFLKVIFSVFEMRRQKWWLNENRKETDNGSKRLSCAYDASCPSRIFKQLVRGWGTDKL